MSTNGTILVYNEQSEALVCIYKHSDGYPSGLGDTLLNFCEPFTIGNSISMGGDPQPYANGMGCFAAFLISHLKEGVGDVYIIPIEDSFTEYIYHIRMSAPVDGYSKLVLTYQDDGDPEQPLKEEQTDPDNPPPGHFLSKDEIESIINWGLFTENEGQLSQSDDSLLRTLLGYYDSK